MSIYRQSQWIHFFSGRSRCLYPLNRWIIIMAANLDGSQIRYEKVAGSKKKTFGLRSIYE